MSWTILRKLQMMVLSIIIIFTVVILLIRGNSNQIFSEFNHFYQQNFLVTLQFERIKELQVDTMVNVRGLQISYLLSLVNHTPGYLETLEENKKSTPKLLQEISQNYIGDSSKLRQLKSLTLDFQNKTELFVSSMKNSEGNKAPLPIFKAFITSYNDLISFSEKFKEQADVSAQVTRASINQVLARSTLIFYFGLIIGIATSISFSYIIAKKISKGIRNVRNSAEKLAEGSLLQQAEINSNDEVSDLAKAINNTISRLKDTIVNITESGQLVAENSTNVLEVNGEMLSASHSISDNTNQLATAIEEMSLTSDSIAKNTTETALFTADIQALTVNGLKSSDLSVQEIHSLLNSLNLSADVVQELKSQTVNIEKILDVIRGISEQTNLLALNAAIEAARAGEQGRGFAVVADEVRGLAQRSQSSVNEIESLLSSLTQAGEQAVLQMNNSSDMAKSLHGQVNQSYDLVKEIQVKVDSVNEQSHQIATAADEQSAVVLKLSKNMHEIKILVDKNSELVEQSNHSSNEMNEASDQVQQRVDFFTIS